MIFYSANIFQMDNAQKKNLRYFTQLLLKWILTGEAHD